jgi:hypothetical protein
MSATIMFKMLSVNSAARSGVHGVFSINVSIRDCDGLLKKKKKRIKMTMDQYDNRVSSFTLNCYLDIVSINQDTHICFKTPYCLLEVTSYGSA